MKSNAMAMPRSNPARRYVTLSFDGRSPGLRVSALVSPSRFPSGIRRQRYPLTVAGAATDSALSGSTVFPFHLPGLHRFETIAGMVAAACLECQRRCPAARNAVEETCRHRVRWGIAPARQVRAGLGSWLAGTSHYTAPPKSLPGLVLQRQSDSPDKFFQSFTGTVESSVRCPRFAPRGEAASPNHRSHERAFWAHR